MRFGSGWGMPSTWVVWLSVAVACGMLSGCKKDRGEACESSAECGENLACVEDGDGKLCSDCSQSSACTKEGRCTLEGDACIATTVEDCERAALCQKGADLCEPLLGECVVERGYYNRESCPCGCDRSEAMVAELADEPTTVLRHRVEMSLETIAEREAAGYITEAMLDHRERLLAFAMDRGQPVPVARWSPLAGAARPEARARVATAPALVSAEDAQLALGAELFAHGRTSVDLAGESKVIEPSFALRLVVENRTDARIQLDAPRLEPSGAFPVARAYGLGTPGEPWDGRLAPGERTWVMVVGPLDAGTLPGTVLAGRVELGELSAAFEGRARARWDEP